MSYSILVVEDDEELRPLLVSVLEDEDYEVEEASNGRRAVELAHDKFFDLIITDIRMEGMDGLEVAEAIHRIQPDVPLIVITGYAANDVPSRAIKQGAYDYLKKPFDLRDFIVTIEDALHSQILLENLSRLTSTIRQDSDKDSEWEKSRARLFQKFYVGVRSERLNKLEASQVWERLQAADSQPMNGQNIYSEVEEFLDAVTSKWTITSGEGAIAADFDHLFEQLKSGKVSRQEVTFAPLLRGLSPEVLGRSEPGLVALKKKLWG